MKRGEKTMRRLTIFLMVLSLIFMSVALSVFGDYANVGPKTNFDGDVGTTGVFKVNDTPLALSDLTTAGLILEAMLDADAPVVGDILTYTENETDFLWKTPSELITAGTLIAWTGTTLNVTIPADHITYDMMQDTSASDKILGRSTAEAGTIEEIACTAFARSILDDADEATFKATVNLEIGTDVLAQQAIGITNDDLVEIDDADNGGVAVTDYARFTANGLEGREPSEVRTDLGLVIGTNVAAAGANTDISSLYNNDLMVGRDASNDLDWSVDDHCTWTINDDVVDLVGFATGVVGNTELPTKGYVDELLGASQTIHFMDVDAATAEYVASLIIADGDQIAKFLKHPDYGRNLTVTGNNVSSAGTCTITGCLADGTTGQTEAIVVSGTSTVQGNKAFVTVTGISVADIAEGFTIGIGDKFGLPVSIDDVTDIYFKTVDGLEEFDEIDGNVDITYNTLDCTTTLQNEDITLYFHI